jgi:hypothetical protein
VLWAVGDHGLWNRDNIEVFHGSPRVEGGVVWVLGPFTAVGADRMSGLRLQGRRIPSDSSPGTNRFL